VAGAATHRVERKRQVACRLKSFRAILLQTAEHDPVDRREGMRCRGRHLRRIVVEDGVHRLDRGVAAKRARAAEHLVEDGAEGENVRAVIHVLTADLFRRHVSDGAEHGSG
jgi:hypothetical protein